MSDKLKKIMEWDNYIYQNIPEGSFCPIDLKDYNSLLKTKYEIVHQYSKGVNKKSNEQDVVDDNHLVDIQRLESIASETYVTSCFLPCYHDFDI